MILDRHWWRTAIPRELVPDGHPDADELAYPAGSEIPDEIAVLLGLMKPSAVKPADAAESDAAGEGGPNPDETGSGLDDAAKAAAQAANKAAKTSANK